MDVSLEINMNGSKVTSGHFDVPHPFMPSLISPSFTRGSDIERYHEVSFVDSDWCIRGGFEILEILKGDAGDIV